MKRKNRDTSLQPRIPTKEEIERDNRRWAIREYYGIETCWDGDESSEQEQDYIKASLLILEDKEIPNDLGKRLLKYKKECRTNKMSDIIRYVNNNSDDTELTGSSAVHFCYGSARNPDTIDFNCLNNIKPLIDMFVRVNRAYIIESDMRTGSESFLLRYDGSTIRINALILTGSHIIYDPCTLNGIRTLKFDNLLFDRLLNMDEWNLGAIHDACYLLTNFFDEFSFEKKRLAAEMLECFDLKKLDSILSRDTEDWDGKEELIEMFTSACNKLELDLLG